RQVLRHRVAEQRAEDADVVAAPVAGADHQLLIELISDAEARREVQAVFDAAIERDAADACYLDLACVDVEEAAVAGLIHRLRIDHVQTQAVVERQLAVGAPGVLRIIEMTPLPLTCI